MGHMLNPMLRQKKNHTMVEQTRMTRDLCVNQCQCGDSSITDEWLETWCEHAKEQRASEGPPRLLPVAVIRH